jgi:dienelactone hydrolase
VKRFLVLAWIGILGLGVLSVAPRAATYLDALSLAARAADLGGVVRHLADLRTSAAVERVVHIPHGAGLRARVYEPVQQSRQTVLLVPGLHPGGIDELRLMTFAREIARTGVTVVTPELPGLVQFRITSTLTDSIEQAARWLATQSGLAPTGKIGLVGASFSGGLSIVAAGRPSLRHRLLYVVSLGGHHDLPRVLYYLCTGLEQAALSARVSDEGAPVTAGARRPPHDYAVAILLLGMADRLVSPDQLEPLRRVLRRYLSASYVDRYDPSRADREFARIRAEMDALTEPSASLIASLVGGDVAALGSSLLPYLDDYGGGPSLSPSRSPKPSVPVFLLHGREDNVIPASESQYLADDFRGHVTVRLFLTDLLSHADIDPSPRVVEVVRLIGFWADLLSR